MTAIFNLDLFPFIVGTYQYVISEQEMSWDDAQAECKKKKGGLLNTESRKEYNFVVEKLDLGAAPLSYWIYGTDFAMKVQQKCFVLNGDQVVANDCAAKRPFICKVKGLYCQT